MSFLHFSETSPSLPVISYFDAINVLCLNYELQGLANEGTAGREIRTDGVKMV